MDVEMRMEQIEKQQAVLNSDLKSLMMDILAKVENMETKMTAMETKMTSMDIKMTAIETKIDALADVVKDNEDELRHLEVNTMKTATDVARLKAVR